MHMIKKCISSAPKGQVTPTAQQFYSLATSLGTATAASSVLLPLMRQNLRIRIDAFGIGATLDARHATVSTPAPPLLEGSCSARPNLS